MQYQFNATVPSGGGVVTATVEAETQPAARTKLDACFTAATPPTVQATADVRFELFLSGAAFTPA